MNWEPKAYQVEGAKRMLKHPAYGLLWEPGLGKTVSTLTALDTMREAGETPALVIAPLRVTQEVWRQEGRKWNHLRHLTIRLLHGPHKAKEAEQTADVYLINYDGLTWLREKGWKLFKRKPRVLVCDESTACKNPRSRRFGHLKVLLPMFRRRYILTGTPSPNGLMDLWAQVYVLDGGKALGKYVTHFRSKFFDPSGYGGYDWTIKPGAEAEIREAVAPLAQYLSADDHLDLPPLTTLTHHVTMPAAAAEAYREMEEDFVAELRDGLVSAVNAGVRVGKLRQLTSGAVYDDGGDWHWVHRRKYEAAEELIDELGGQPLLVAYEFDHEREALESLTGWPVLAGRTSAAKTRGLVKAWNAGELPGMLVQPQAAGHGLNLQHGPCQHLLWTSGTWSLELAEQMVGRLHRQGQQRPVFVHRLVARDTIDEHVWARVDYKGDRQQGLLDFLREVYR